MTAARAPVRRRRARWSWLDLVLLLGLSGLLGYLGGEMLLTDPAVPQYLGEVSHTWVQVAGALGAVLVVGLGMYFNKRHRQAQAAAAA